MFLFKNIHTLVIKDFVVISCDAPDFWQLRLQEPATTTMEGLLLFNKHVLATILGIVVLVSWLLFHTIYSYQEFNTSSPSSFYHSNVLEIVWTSLPALILLMLSSPSFSLLYSMDELTAPDFSIKVLGHQWFWSYEVSDFRSCLGNKTLKYSCYMLNLEDLRNNKGFFRNLETNKRVILPTKTHMRLLVSAVDVLHSWTIPSFGIKIDACPGRLNQVNLFIKRMGLFFGQCSEICGVNHGFMPIVVLTLPLEQYQYMIFFNLEGNK